MKDSMPESAPPNMGSNMGPNMGHMGPNMGHMGPNMGHMGPNMGPNMGQNMGQNMGPNMYGGGHHHHQMPPHSMPTPPPPPSMNQHHQTSQDMSEHVHSNNYQQQHSFQDEGGMANMDLGTIHILRCKHLYRTKLNLISNFFFYKNCGILSLQNNLFFNITIERNFFHAEV